MVATAEQGIPEEVLAGWRSEFGHRMEEDFGTCLEKTGVEILREKPDSQKSEKLVKEGRIAALRATPAEDFEQGIDWHLFNPLTGRLVPVDISVSNNPAIHAEKRERERTRGIRFLPLAAREVQLGARGGERDLGEVWRDVNVLLLQDALDQARSGRVEFPEAKMARIEQRLHELQGVVH